MSPAATPASASAPSATSTISDSTSRPSCLPNLLCAHPTIHPVIMASAAVLRAATIARPRPPLYPDLGLISTFPRARDMADSRDTITIRRPDDWHVHFRDGAMLAQVAPLTARQFARAVVMPNLVPPVTTAAAAKAYRERILAALPPGAEFTPLMTCYLTDTTAPDEVARGFAEGAFIA